MRNELQEGERCRPNCDGRGLFYCTKCLTRIDGNRTQNEEVEVTDLDPEQNVKPESSCQDGALMAEDEAKLAGRASSHSPDLESLAYPKAQKSQRQPPHRRQSRQWIPSTAKQNVHLLTVHPRR